MITFSSDLAAKNACQQFDSHEQHGIHMKVSLSSKNPSKQSPREITAQMNSLDTDDQSDASPSSKYGQGSPAESPRKVSYERTHPVHKHHHQQQQDNNNVHPELYQTQPNRTERINASSFSQRSSEHPPSRQPASQQHQQQHFIAAPYQGNQYPNAPVIAQVPPPYHQQEMSQGGPQMYPGAPTGYSYPPQGGPMHAPPMWPHYAMHPHYAQVPSPQIMNAYNHMGASGAPYMVPSHPQQDAVNNSNPLPPMMYHQALPPQAIYPYHPSYGGMVMNGESSPSNNSVPMHVVAASHPMMNSKHSHYNNHMPPASHGNHNSAT